MNGEKKLNTSKCRHDYKNAIEISEYQHVCKLCNKQIDPSEYFLITQLESMGAKFVDVTPYKKIKKSAKVSKVKNITKQR